ncbi:MAG: hypothetical protein IKX45_05415 [Bacteroidales bacterium]|nr:hypothetical protein [Bacteroidales bacterium]
MRQTYPLRDRIEYIVAFVNEFGQRFHTQENCRLRIKEIECPQRERFCRLQAHSDALFALALAVLVIPRALLAAKCTCEVKLSATARTAEAREKAEEVQASQMSATARTAEAGPKD